MSLQNLRVTHVLCFARMRVWLFPKKTRYSAAQALDFLRERKVIKDEEEPTADIAEM